MEAGSRTLKKRQPSKAEEGLGLWPWGVPAALAAVPLLWLVIGLALWLAHRWADWPSAATAGGVVYIVAAIGLIPVALLALDAIARQRGAITTKWFSVDFSKAVAGRERPAVEIETGLGFTGQPITDSSVVAVHETLNRARGNDLVRLDLGAGDRWWTTRLFALCAGARQSGAPHALVFVGRDLGVDGAFLGWIRPNDALRLLRAQRAALRYAHDRAASIARYLTTVAAVPSVPPSPPPDPPEPQLQPLTVPATAYVQPPFQGLGEDTDLRILLDLLGKYEHLKQATGGVEPVTVDLLHEVFGDELHRQWVDLSWSKERQLEEFLQMTDDYLGTVDRGRFERLVDRRSLENALLRQVLSPGTPSG